MPNCLSETISILFLFFRRRVNSSKIRPELSSELYLPVSLFFVFFRNGIFLQLSKFLRAPVLKEVEKEVSDVVQFRERGDEVFGHYCPNETLTVAREEGDELAVMTRLPRGQQSRSNWLLFPWWLLYIYVCCSLLSLCCFLFFFVLLPHCCVYTTAKRRTKSRSRWLSLITVQGRKEKPVRLGCVSRALIHFRTDTELLL